MDQGQWIICRRAAGAGAGAGAELLDPDHWPGKEHHKLRTADLMAMCLSLQGERLGSKKWNVSICGWPHV